MPCYPTVAPFQHSTIQSPLFAPSATASPTGHLDDREIEVLVTVALLVYELPVLRLMLCRFSFSSSGSRKRIIRHLIGNSGVLRLMRTAMPSIWAFPGSFWTLSCPPVVSVVSDYKTHIPVLELVS
jgi:hypothetical protein